MNLLFMREIILLNPDITWQNKWLLMATFQPLFSLPVILLQSVQCVLYMRMVIKFQMIYPSLVLMISALQVFQTLRWQRFIHRLNLWENMLLIIFYFGQKKILWISKLRFVWHFHAILLFVTLVLLRANSH
jgi:transcriptional regulator, LacI family